MMHVLHFTGRKMIHLCWLTCGCGARLESEVTDAKAEVLKHKTDDHDAQGHEAEERIKA